MTTLPPDQILFKFRRGPEVFTLYTDSKLHRLFRDLYTEFPNLRIRAKADCWWHRMAHYIIVALTLGQNKLYLENMTTTRPDNIALSGKHWKRLHGGSREDHDRVWETIMHERRHLRDFQELGSCIMVLLWLIPPIFVCWGRAAVIEKPGYLVSLQCKFENNRAWAEGPEYREWWINCFTGPAYGWMYTPFRKSVASWFDAELLRLQQEAASGS